LHTTTSGSPPSTIGFPLSSTTTPVSTMLPSNAPPSSGTAVSSSPHPKGDMANAMPAEAAAISPKNFARFRDGPPEL
jgi:hypothetical protein